MSKWHGNDQTCEFCGLKYRDYKTGLTFSDVRMMLWVGDDDYTRWKYKRRHTVLGLWHSIKLRLWDSHQYECELQAEYDRSAKEAAEKLPVELAELHEVLRRSEERIHDDVVPF
jgi:hypothetical protein